MPMREMCPPGRVARMDFGSVVASPTVAVCGTVTYSVVINPPATTRILRALAPSRAPP